LALLAFGRFRADQGTCGGLRVKSSDAVKLLLGQQPRAECSIRNF
jgi:hypothetical protein